MADRVRSRRRYLHGLATASTLALAGCTGLGRPGGGGPGDGSSDDRDLTVFHAGSLETPFGRLEPTFESDTGIEVRREARGSVASTKKLTEQGRRADVLGVSDFRLLRDRLLPDFGDWYAVFATNAMAIQYREDAPGADEISTDNWWTVLGREDVTVGHSDPAVDPGGYRAVMVQQLGAIPFDGDRLYDDATYDRLRANSTVSTDTETNLTGQLESGALDYAIYYRSVAESTGLPSVDLQPTVDLSELTDEYASHYAEATVETDAGTFTGAPIAYGVTVPAVAESPALGARWIERFATDSGRTILADSGFRTVEPVVVPAASESAVPEPVRDHARAASTVGPLPL